MLYKRKAYKEKIEFIRLKVIDHHEAICEFYKCRNRGSDGAFNIIKLACRICEMVRRSKRLAIEDGLYYCPRDDIQK